MESQENELQSLISTAFRAGDPKKLFKILELIYNRANLKKCHMKKTDIEKLNKLSEKAPL
jgi:transcriptional regulator